MKSRIHATERVENADRKFGAARFYYPAMIHLPNVSRPAMFTEDQVMDAIERARQNPEDVPSPSLWERLVWWLR